MTRSPSPQIAGLTIILSRIEDLAQSNPAARVTLRDVVTAFGRDSMTTLLLFVALVIVSPLSGIPGSSTVVGLLIALLSIQILIGRDHVWLPGWLMRRGIAGARVIRAIGFLKPTALWIDRHIRPRFHPFVAHPLDFLIPFVTLAAGLIMPLLEILPFTSSYLGLVTMLFSLAMLTRDGLLALIAYILSAGFVFTGLALIRAGVAAVAS